MENKNFVNRTLQTKIYLYALAPPTYPQFSNIYYVGVYQVQYSRINCSIGNEKTERSYKV